MARLTGDNTPNLSVKKFSAYDDVNKAALNELIDDIDAGTAGIGGGNPISAFYRGYNTQYANVSIAAGYTSNLVNTTTFWAMDMNGIGLDWSSPGVSTTGAFANTTGASLNLYIEAVVCTVDANSGWQFIPQTSSDSGASWTNSYAPGTTRQLYTGAAGGNVTVASLVTVPDTYFVRLAGYNADSYTRSFSVKTCKITKK